MSSFIGGIVRPACPPSQWGPSLLFPPPGSCRGVSSSDRLGGEEISQATLRTSGGDGAALLLERGSELEAFEGALDRLDQGIGSMILVEGPAGIGKTRLLAEAVRIARARTSLVRSARGGQLEREMPFSIARELLESVVERSSEEERAQLLAGSAGLALAALGREDPERTGGTPDPIAAVHGLYWLVANLAEMRPLVLIGDDLHWADAQSLRWLEYLARRLDDLPVLLVLAARAGEPDEPPELDELRREAQLIHPSPLSRSAVEELISAQLQARPSAEFSAACTKVTAGNPFLLAEVLRALRADEIEPGAQAAGAISELGPESVARYVLMRLARFGSEAISIARAIAVLGAAPQLRHLAILAGLAEEDVLRVCDSLRDAEILAPGLPIEFVHPLVRAAIYTELSEGQRSATHRRAAGLLGETGAEAREIAPHLLACAPNGDQRVVGWLGEAAFDAGRAGAFDGAVTYLERALAEPPEDEFPFRHALGRSMLQVDPARARGVLNEVVERTPDPRMRVRALRDAAIANFVAGDWQDAIRCNDRLLEALPEAEQEQRLVAEAERYLVELGSLGRERASGRIRSVATGLSGATPGECLARQALGIDLFMSCAPVDRVVELAGSFPPHPWELRTNIPSAACRILGWSGRWDDVRRVLRRMIDLARKRGMVVNVSYWSGLMAELDRGAGRLIDAEAEARTGLEIAGAAISKGAGREGRLNLLATVIARGDTDEAGRLAAGVDLSAGLREGLTNPGPTEVRGYLRLAQGELELGVQDLLEYGDQAEAWGRLNPAISPWRQEAGPALAAIDRTSEGVALIAEAERRARAFGAPHAIGAVLRSRALLEPRTRQIETLRESVSVLEVHGAPHQLARSLLELGAALRRDGQRADSRPPLQHALELAHRSGAGGIEKRAREELAAAGSRPRSVYRTGIASLTASEFRTARLAAEGLSNTEIAQRLFVTRKTVEKHLGNAYTKLEIAGRAELARALEDSSAATR